MLSSAADGVQLEDWILLPNLSEAGSFLVAQVAGPYYYEWLSLPEENDIDGLGKDYGHVLPVRLITEHGVNKIVDARIRSTLKAQRRMWNVDACGDALERLVNQYNASGDFSTARSGKARFHTALELARSHAEEQFREPLGPALDSYFQAISVTAGAQSAARPDTSNEDSSRMKVGRLASFHAPGLRIRFRTRQAFCAPGDFFTKRSSASSRNFEIRRNKRYRDRYQLIGTPLGGRRLKIIFQLKPESVVRIITGWPL
jgi:hypothetical protein